MERFAVAPGIELRTKPIIWKQKKGEHFPPFANRLLSFHPSVKPAEAESTTWTCFPEPLIVNLIWDAGGTDEFFRLVNQSFTILKATDPNTGITSASATYEANLIASGKAYNPEAFYMEISLLNAQGGPLGSPAMSPGANSVFVSCRDNRPFSVSGTFNPGLWDIIAGAHWYFTYFQVQGC
jgi:hypothetical protein